MSCVPWKKIVGESPRSIGSATSVGIPPDTETAPRTLETRTAPTKLTDYSEATPGRHDGGDGSRFALATAREPARMRPWPDCPGWVDGRELTILDLEGLEADLNSVV